MTETKRVLITAAPFYRDITDQLIAGATGRLSEAGVAFDVREAPGALELPGMIRIASEADTYDGFIALGCVIRGETSHYDTVAGESARGIMDLGTRWGLAIGNGVLTVENREQAVERADPAQKNKGADAAEACLALMALREEMIPWEDEWDEDEWEENEGSSSHFLPDSEHIQIAKDGEDPHKSA